jgi:hypothetical protein
MAETDRFEIVLIAEPSRAGVPVEIRMRQALKTLLRVFGFRCVSIARTGKTDGVAPDASPAGGRDTRAA